MPRLFLALSTGAVMSLGLAATPAFAAGPQIGRYDCFFPNGFSTGELRILSHTKYRVGDERGRYVVDGKRLRIRSGPHKGLWKSVTWSTRPDLYGKPRSTILFHPKNVGSSLLQCTRH